MLTWWQERVVYQIYPRSFKDSNGDGLGDLAGIIEELDNLRDLGIGVLWLSPVYPSPDADNGYDISDYRNIDPRYGSLADMDRLIAEAERRDIKIIMDLVINHTSDQHPWFQASRDPASPYRDWYLWRPGRKGRQPNNWTSFFAGRCWEFDERSGEFYLHLFSKEQPDLNWRNPAVLAEIESIMRFWLDRGIAGFRCDVINVIYKTSLENGRQRLVLTGSEHYLSQPGVHEILRTLRADVLNRYDCFAVGETVFVSPLQARDLCLPERRELDMVFTFSQMETDQLFVKWFKRRFHAGRLARNLARWQADLPWNANYLENHDQPRSVSRFGDDGRYWAESAKLLATLLFSLRGTPFVYQGQEIGMTNFDFTSMDQVRDVESHSVYAMAGKLGIPRPWRWLMIRFSSRDNGRTPMQWTAGPNAGFSRGTPWLGVNHNHRRINLATQLGDPSSVRSWYKLMIALRAAEPVLLAGSFVTVKTSRSLFAFRRELAGQAPLLVLLNFSARQRFVPSALGIS